MSNPLTLENDVLQAFLADGSPHLSLVIVGDYPLAYSSFNRCAPSACPGAILGTLESDRFCKLPRDRDRPDPTRILGLTLNECIAL